MDVWPADVWFTDMAVSVSDTMLCLSQEGDEGIAKETDPSVPSKDDIPTFDEWKKQVMEVEKEKSMCICYKNTHLDACVKKCRSRDLYLIVFG